MAMRIIGYTYDADVHCRDCTHERFGRQLVSGYDPLSAEDEPLDSEGNPINPIFDITEDPLGGVWTCGDCGEELV